VPCIAFRWAPPPPLLQLWEGGLHLWKLWDVREGDGKASLQPRRDHRTLGQGGVARHPRDQPHRLEGEILKLFYLKIYSHEKKILKTMSNLRTNIKIRWF